MVKVLTLLIAASCATLVPQNVICCKIAATASSDCAGGNTTTSVVNPPSSGSYPYSPPGSWIPGDASFTLAAGGTYVDPVLGGVVRRESDLYPELGGDHQYSSNGWMSKDDTYLYQSRSTGSARVLVVATGAILCAGTVPDVQDIWFSPIDDDVAYYWSGLTIRKFFVHDCSTSLYKTFTGSGSLISIGGALDSMDRTARYFVVRYDNNTNTRTRIWDSQTDTIYTGGIALDPGQGYNAGITPDGSAVCYGANNDGRCWPINHAGTTLVDTYVQIQTLGNGHNDLICPSDGHCYMVTSFCNGPCGMAAFRTDVDMTGQSQAVQIASPNKTLVTVSSGEEVSGTHYACAGMTSDWCWFSSENTDDLFGNKGTWRNYKSEIVGMNIVTGVIRRYAQHRARSTLSQYYASPRIGVSWDGYVPFWVSNYGYDAGGLGYGDKYTTDCRVGTSVAPVPAPLLALGRILRGEVSR